MTLKISGKGVDLGTALRGRVEEAITAAVDKYFDGSFSGHATLSKSGSAFEADCAVHLDTGLTFEATGRDHDPTTSFEIALEHLEKRLRRYKRRLKDHNRGLASGPDGGAEASTFVLSGPEENEEVAADFAPAIVAEAKTTVLTMSVSAAVLHLDRTDAPVVVFRNANHGRLNVVFRRRDGNFGWIDPELADRRNG